jgi:integrase
MSGSVFKRCSCKPSDLPVDVKTGKPRTCSKQHGSWWFHTRAETDPVTGKAKRVARGGYRTKRDAEAALAEITTKIRSGTWTDDEGVTVAAWLDSWLQRKEANGLRPATVRVYRQHINDYLKPGLGSIRLRDLRPGHVADMLDRLQTHSGSGGHQLSANTVTRVHACLRSALGTAVKMRLVAFNAARDVELPKVNRKRVKPWQPAELGAFLDAVQGDRLGALFETVAASGMRRGEVCGLRWEDLDPVSGVITVKQQLTERSGDDSVCPFAETTIKGFDSPARKRSPASTGRSNWTR